MLNGFFGSGNYLDYLTENGDMLLKYRIHICIILFRVFIFFILGLFLSGCYLEKMNTYDNLRISENENFIEYKIKNPIYSPSILNEKKKNEISDSTCWKWNDCQKNAEMSFPTFYLKKQEHILQVSPSMTYQDWLNFVRAANVKEQVWGYMSHKLFHDKNTCKVDYILINAYLFDSRYSDLTMLFNQSGLLYFSLRTSLKNKIGEIGSASGVFYPCPLGKEQMEKIFGKEYRNSVTAYFSKM